MRQRTRLRPHDWICCPWTVGEKNSCVLFALKDILLVQSRFQQNLHQHNLRKTIPISVCSKLVCKQLCVLHYDQLNGKNALNEIADSNRNTISKILPSENNCEVFKQIQCNNSIPRTKFTKILILVSTYAIQT